MIKRVEQIDDRVTLTVYPNGFFYSLDLVAVSAAVLEEKFGHEYVAQLKTKARPLVPDNLKWLV